MKLFILLLLPAILLASQKECENNVFHIAKRFTLYPSTIVGIAKTETNCRMYISGDDKTSHGPMQFQLPTARDVIRWYPKELGYLASKTDEELKTLLLTNLYVSVKMASLLFEHHRKAKGYKLGVIDYNGRWAVTPQGKPIRMNGKRILNVQYFARVQRNKQEYINSKKHH